MPDRLPTFASSRTHQIDVEAGTLICRSVVRPVFAPDGVRIVAIEQLEVIDSLAVKIGVVDSPVTEVDIRRKRAAVSFLDDLFLNRHEIAKRYRAKSLSKIMQRGMLISLRFNDRSHGFPIRFEQVLQRNAESL